MIVAKIHCRPSRSVNGTATPAPIPGILRHIKDISYQRGIYLCIRYTTWHRCSTRPYLTRSCHAAGNSAQRANSLSHTG
jgi:hypothetical protein